MTLPTRFPWVSTTDTQCQPAPAWEAIQCIRPPSAILQMAIAGTEGDNSQGGTCRGATGPLVDPQLLLAGTTGLATTQHIAMRSFPTPHPHPPRPSPHHHTTMHACMHSWVCEYLCHRLRVYSLGCTVHDVPQWRVILSIRPPFRNGSNSYLGVQSTSCWVSS